MKRRTEGRNGLKIRGRFYLANLESKKVEDPDRGGVAAGIYANLFGLVAREAAGATRSALAFDLCPRYTLGVRGWIA